MTTDKRLAIENHSSDEVLVFDGEQLADYLIVKQINLASSIDNCSKVYSLSIRVYPMRHSDNLLFIDFRITDPCGNFAVFKAGSIGKSYILWTDTACSIVSDFYPDAIGEDSVFLSDTLESTIRALIPYVRQSKMRTTKNKDKVKKSKKSKQLQAITKETSLFTPKKSKSKPRENTIKDHPSISKHGVLIVKNPNPLPENLETFGYGYKAHYSNAPRVKQLGSIGTNARF